MGDFTVRRSFVDEIRDTVFSAWFLFFLLKFILFVKGFFFESGF